MVYNMLSNDIIACTLMLNAMRIKPLGDMTAYRILFERR